MTRWELAEQRALWALVGASTTGDPARIARARKHLRRVRKARTVEARTVVVTGEVVS